MNQRKPEPNKWYCLDKDKLQQEEAKQEDPSSEEEDLDESMDSGTSGEWGSLWVRYNIYLIFYIFSCITNSLIFIADITKRNVYQFQNPKSMVDYQL